MIWLSLIFDWQDKEVAIKIKKLPPGTVVFEDVSPETYRGVITKVIPRFTNKKSAESFPGKVVYNLQEGGWVLATDTVNIHIEERTDASAKNFIKEHRPSW